jgi:predicted Zn-dependent peptidase
MSESAIVHKVHEVRLANGIPLTVVERPGLKSAYLQVNVHRGGWDGLPGMAHFVEHMLFRGSARYPTTAAIQLALDAAVSADNGSTNELTTDFTSEALPEHLDVVATVFADMLSAPLFDPQDLAIERALPESQIHQLCIGLWGPYYGDPNTGTAAIVRRMTREQLMAHWEQCFVAELLSIVVVSPLPWQKTREQLRAFDSFPRALGPTLRRSVSEYKLPATKGPFLAVRRDARVGCEALFCFVPPVEYQNGDWSDLSVLEAALDHAESRLWHALRTDAGLAYDLGVDVIQFGPHAALFLRVATDVEHIVYALEAVFRVLDVLVSAPMSDEEVATAVRRAAHSVLCVDDDVEALSLHYSRIRRDVPPPSLSTKIERIQAVTPAWLHERVRALIRPENTGLVVCGFHDDSDQRLVEAKAAAWLRLPPSCF